MQEPRASATAIGATEDAAARSVIAGRDPANVAGYIARGTTLPGFKIPLGSKSSLMPR
jgi:hypothetical protein